jgi:hypothetical protein
MCNLLGFAMDRKNRKDKQKADFKPVLILFFIVTVLYTAAITLGVKG